MKIVKMLLLYSKIIVLRILHVYELLCYRCVTVSYHNLSYIFRDIKKMHEKVTHVISVQRFHSRIIIIRGESPININLQYLIFSKTEKIRKK